MDAVGVEALADGARLLHEVGDGLVGDHNVHRRDGLLLVQPPDVQLVDRLDAGNLSDRRKIVSAASDFAMHARGMGWAGLGCTTHLLEVVLDVPQVDAAGGALQQDGAAVLDEGQRREQDHDGDAHARAGVGVEARRVVGLPDHQGGDDDADVVEGVADDVGEHAEHAQVAAGALKLGCVVAVLCVRLDGLRRR